jgi:glycosyltransferase involved in cell wall biosynthesis
MIDAFNELATTLPRAELIFVGPDRGLLDDAGHTHSLPDYLDSHLAPSVKARVQVTGAVDAERIRLLRKQAHVTVVPSRYENFPLALVESLAHGCPTVGADVGGIPEILLDEQTGLLFRSGDKFDLAAKITELFRNPERAAALGDRAFFDIAHRLNPESIARATLAFYEEVLARAQPQTIRRRMTRGIFLLTGFDGHRGTSSTVGST